MQSQRSSRPGAVEERAGERTAFGWRFVAPLCIGAALNPINSTMVATALATIGERLHAGADQTVWLISVLYLTSAISQPVAGRIADRIGPRKVFVTGSVIVAVAGVAGIFVHTLWGLVALRALIGSGTGAVYPAAMAMVRRRADSLGLPPPNRVLGWLSTASLTTLTIGPLLAGLLVQTVGWQWIFIVNLPLALLCLVLVLRFAPPDDPRAPGERADLDAGGIALFGVTIVALLFFLMQLRSPRWWILGVAVVVIIALVYYERRREHPFVDVRMLAGNRALLITYGRIVASFVVLYGAMFGLSQWFEEARGLSPIQVGLLMLLIFGVGAFLSTIGSRFTAVRTPLVIGAAGMIAGSLLMVGVDSRSAVWLFALMCLAHAPSAGLSMLANQMAIYVQAPADQIGMASGLSRTAQYLGAIIGSGIIALAFGARPTDAGLHLVGWILTGVGVVVAVAVALDRSLDRRRSPLSGPA
ncbi:MFS transporter [Cumulibacter manganitolerans]|uniref:MFS transporter n=1 Tax=Cumulibacter manganitolerans TaxID=1884992 RepID=UPI001295D351|nr:MFS transporter [Cumulibacter manganitolerans]